MPTAKPTTHFKKNNFSVACKECLCCSFDPNSIVPVHRAAQSNPEKSKYPFVFQILHLFYFLLHFLLFTFSRLLQWNKINEKKKILIHYIRISQLSGFRFAVNAIVKRHRPIMIHDHFIRSLFFSSLFPLFFLFMKYQ